MVKGIMPLIHNDMVKGIMPLLYLNKDLYGTDIPEGYITLCFELNIPTNQYFEKICSLRHNQLKGSMVLKDYIKYFSYAKNKNMFDVSRLYALTLTSFQSYCNNTIQEGSIVEINNNWTLNDLNSFEKPSHRVNTNLPDISKFRIYPWNLEEHTTHNPLICKYIIFRIFKFF